MRLHAVVEKCTRHGLWLMQGSAGAGGASYAHGLETACPLTSDWCGESSGYRRAGDVKWTPIPVSGERARGRSDA